MTRWAVRLRYRGVDPALSSSSWQERRALAVWLGEVLGDLEEGTYHPVGVVVYPHGTAVSLRVEAGDSYQAILRAAQAVGEVVGDVDRILGPLAGMSTVPPSWELTPAFPRPC